MEVSVNHSPVIRLQIYIHITCQLIHFVHFLFSNIHLNYDDLYALIMSFLPASENLLYDGILWGNFSKFEYLKLPTVKNAN